MEKPAKLFTFQTTPQLLDALNKLAGNRRAEFVRQAIAEKLSRDFGVQVGSVELPRRIWFGSLSDEERADKIRFLAERSRTRGAAPEAVKAYRADGLNSEWFRWRLPNTFLRDMLTEHSRKFLAGEMSKNEALALYRNFLYERTTIRAALTVVFARNCAEAGARSNVSKWFRRMKKLPHFAEFVAALNLDSKAAVSESLSRLNQHSTALHEAWRALVALLGGTAPLGETESGKDFRYGAALVEALVRRIEMSEDYRSTASKEEKANQNLRIAEMHRRQVEIYGDKAETDCAKLLRQSLKLDLTFDECARAVNSSVKL